MLIIRESLSKAIRTYVELLTAIDSAVNSSLNHSTEVFFVVWDQKCLLSFQNTSPVVTREACVMEMGGIHAMLFKYEDTAHCSDVENIRSVHT